ncbi:hypothetical protein [Falsiroseomonas sp. HW251]|uniref:hypothetical protein n=1 Tax=Falsiroseomonas sp. HW251 TaxID=3390998 RepID=UPI003D31E5A1
MNAILAAFPRRPLALKPARGAWRGWLALLLGLVLFGGFLAMLAIDVLPGIRDDFAIRDAARPAVGARITEGRCRSRLFLFQSCELTLSFRGKERVWNRKLSYLFVEPHMGNWSAVPMADPARPELVSTDIGLDRLWNRVATLAGSGVVGLLLIGGLALAVRKQGGAGKALKALSGRMLVPVPVLFEGWGEGPSWKVLDEHGARHEWPAARGSKPFILDPQRGLVLALRDPAGGPAYPLDEKLRLVVLTPEERAAVLAAAAARG